VPDPLNLSLWLRDRERDPLIERFETLLRVFPFSRQRPGIASVRVYALEYAEPPVFEYAFAEETDASEVAALCREFANPDCAYTVEGWWDLWTYDRGWRLEPSAVSVTCFGPEFENPEEDHFRIDLGPESRYLPEPGLPEGTRMAQSNLKSVLRLAGELAESLPLEGKRLWTESDEDFAERLEEVLEEEG
jgi:hypothetical protein